jgi:hypothetical protein
MPKPTKTIERNFDAEYKNIREKISSLRLAIRLLKEEFEKLPRDLQEIIVKLVEK